MIARFVARGGVLGTVVLVVLAVAVIGFAGAVVEHYRLASQQEQQGGQSEDQTGSNDQSNTQSQEGQSNSSSADGTQENDNASGSRQQDGQQDQAA